MFKVREAKMLRKVLANKDARQELFKRVRKQFGVKGQIGDGTILQLLLDHADEIIAILKELIKLFAL